MPIELSQGFRFGGFTAEPLKGSIAGDDGQSRHLAPKAMDVLVRLAEAAPKPVTRDDLITAVWGERYVCDEVLTHAIKELRHALDDSPTKPQYIQTIPKRGYRLLKKARPIDDPAPAREGRKWRYLAFAASLVVAVLALGWFVGDFGQDTESTVAPTEADEVTVSGITVTPSPRIAVLAFADLSPDGDQEYFSDGISLDILNLLAQIKSLKVIAPQSSFSFKGQNVDIATIAAKLDVSYVVAGSVRRSGDHVRITAQLIDATDSSHLWSEAYDRPFRDIVALQDDIALNIASALEIALVDRERPDSTRSLTGNADAYAMYLQGRSLLHQRMREGAAGLGAAISLFENAIRHDPDFAPAWAGLGKALWLRPYYRDNENRDADHRRAEDAARQALELDPYVAEALSILGNLAWKRGDFEAADSYYEQAMQQPAPDSDVWLWTGIFQDTVGYTDKALEIYEQANRLDPFNDNLIGFLTRSYWMKGEAEKALRIANTRPIPPWTEYGQAMGRLVMGDHQGARALLTGMQLPYGVFLPKYVDLVFDALAEPERMVEAEQGILEAVDSGALNQRTAFELLWILSSPATLKMSPDLVTGYRVLRVSEIAWSVRGKAFRNDERFHHWVHEIGLVDYWNRHGWPDQCKAGQGRALVCD